MQQDENMDWESTDSNLKNRVPSDQIGSSEDDDDTDKDAESIETQIKPKLRGAGRSYILIEEFESLNFSKEARNKNDDYTYRGNRASQAGEKYLYTCSNNNKCPKTMYLLLHNDSQKCSLFQSELEHNHSNNTHKSRLPQSSVDFITEQVKMGVKRNNQLVQGLLAKGLPQLTFAQINGLKAKLKVEMYGRSDFTFKEILEW